jgi:iron complex outermembrane receptor protein
MAALAAALSGAAMAQEPQYRFDLPPQEIKFALRAVTREAGLQLFAGADDLRGLRSPDLHADTTAEEALQRLLAGTGLHAEMNGRAVFIRGRLSAAEEHGAEARPGLPASNDIVVTGSRIRGAHISSPVIALSRQDMIDQGETDLGQVVRDIPQSFSGGQNPGVVANTPGLQNQNFNASSTINLRGLGPDATLTLINGHRLSYDGASQAVDISSIPVAAIERLEVVADGSSAIYGSDAVGGVANIILRKDYEGVETEARLGTATDGGGFQQQYDVVGGRRWNTGGFIATYDFQRSTAISAGQRSYTSGLDGSTTLLPSTRQHSAILSAHQDLGSDFSISVDGTFNHRLNRLGYPDTVSEPYDVLGVAKEQVTTSFSIAPRVDWHAPLNWLVSLSGVYGRDRTNFGSLYYSGGIQYEQIAGHYTDQSKIAEFSAEGPLFHLPGGNARLALGAGYRQISLRGFGRIVAATFSLTAINYNYSRPSSYGYGELYLPFFSPDNGLAGLARLEATAALRYERYGRLGNDATPKFGLTYAPVVGLALRGTWARSFKTPTLYQQHTGYTATLYSAASTGAVDAQPNATVLDIYGGNPDLKSERATSWTAGFELQPVTVPSLKIEVSFFGIHYKERINDVSVPLDNVLNNPAYQALITRNPSIADVEALIDGAFSPLTNLSDVPYDPANVAAIVDDRYLNVSSQRLHGIDFALSDDIHLAGAGRISLSGSATYLKSNQRLLPTVSSVSLAGTIYNPPHWRARVGGTWHDDKTSASLFVNYTGSVTDNTTLPLERVASMTTVDLAARRNLPGRGVLSGLTIAISALNLLNAKPAVIRETDPTQPPYDSTNYSAVGRLISISLTKKW